MAGDYYCPLEERVRPEVGPGNSERGSGRNGARSVRGLRFRRMPSIQFVRARRTLLCIAQAMNSAANQFEGLLARYFETLLQDNPTFSTICAGLPDGEGKLGRLTLDFRKKRRAERQ